MILKKFYEEVQRAHSGRLAEWRTLYEKAAGVETKQAVLQADIAETLRRQKELRAQLADLVALASSLSATAKRADLSAEIPKVQETVGRMLRDLHMAAY
ncbi:unnamed protein product [Amoebophrya sp. A25]|nr:unnamed protein product [Amoebophrya sp. A25]|eukprot:GSA25T00018713001.1